MGQSDSDDDMTSSSEDEVEQVEKKTVTSKKSINVNIILKHKSLHEDVPFGIVLAQE